ncbi:MAG TPA: HdeA/HdeB family chaperone [Methyloceanibacter sp.]
MKPLYVTILAAGMLLTVNPVFAEESKIDMSKLTCKQFAAYDKDNMSIIMMWLEGYYTKEDEVAVIDFGKMAATLRISSFIAATILMTTSSTPQTRYGASRGPLDPLGTLAFPGSVMI